MKKISLLVAAFAFIATTSFAQDHGLFHQEFLGNFTASSDKVEGLCEAIPAEKYDWRPAEGIRSVKEACMHVAAANYFFASMMGVAIPDGINPQELESIGSKDEAMEVLTNSIAHVKSAIEGVSEEDFDNEIDLFGQPGNILRLLFVVSEHMAEHQGQLIAYARSNDVTPPWSQ